MRTKNLELKNICKNFDHKSMAQLKDVSLNVESGEIVSMIGPSGTGKSTLLNVILNKLKPESGEIFYGEELIVSHNYENDNYQKRFSFVPQTPTLNNEITIFKNIIAPIINEMDAVTAENKVRDMIEIFGLEYKDHKYPQDLSAGQRQRVEFAKALVSDPEFLLLDEPFSNLDQFLKEDVIDEVFPIFRERGLSVLMVTHNLDEAFSVSDRIVLLANGKVQQAASPRDLYDRPSNAFSARFTGKINLLASNYVSTLEGVTRVKNILGEFEVNSDIPGGKQFVYLAIRPENVELSENGSIVGKVKKIDYRGDSQFIYVQTMDRNKFILRRAGSEKYELDQRLKFNLPQDKLFFLPI